MRSTEVNVRTPTVARADVAIVKRKVFTFPDIYYKLHFREHFIIPSIYLPLGELHNSFQVFNTSLLDSNTSHDAHCNRHVKLLRRPRITNKLPPHREQLGPFSGKSIRGFFIDHT